MDLKQLKRPTKAAKAKTAPEPAEPASSPQKPVPAATANLHQPPRGEIVPKQFKIPAETRTEFEITARERGYRRDSDFFIEVWEFYKSNH